MGTTTDDRGRIYLPKKIRERFGDEYRIVELPNRVVLLPIPEDPLDGLHAAVGEAFAGKRREELAAEARAKAEADLTQERPNSGEE